MKNRNYPYVYKLTHKESKEFYIGYREANELPSILDLGFKYKTSSEKIRKLGFHNFDIEILFECHHEDREIAASYAYDIENEMIAENFDNILCLNGFHFDGKRKRFRNNDNSWAKGKVVPEEQRIKHRATCANRTDEEKSIISDIHKAAWSDERKANLSEKVRDYWADPELGKERVAKLLETRRANKALGKHKARAQGASETQSSDEFKSKCADRGRNISDETRKKRSDAAKAAHARKVKEKLDLINKDIAE